MKVQDLVGAKVWVSAPSLETPTKLPVVRSDGHLYY